MRGHRVARPPRHVVVALAMGSAAGLGALQVSGLIGTDVILFRQLSWKRGIPLAALATLALLIVAGNLVPLVLDGGGLNHDESAYALKARHWIEETPETGWNLHRGIAMSGYGYLVFEAGGDEAALRFLGLVALAGFVWATWVLGRRIGGNWVGPLSAIALMSSPVLLRRSTEYLSDVPSSALLMAVMIVVWRQFGGKDRPGFGLLWILPFAWTAFYLRYQSVLSFGLIAVMIFVLFREKVVPGWRPILITGLVGLLGLVPHLQSAISETGSPWGIILFTADVAGRQFLGEGLIDYFLLMGWPLAAFVGPFAVVFFVWWLMAGWRSPFERSRCLFLMIPAAGQVLVLGMLSHGEARFIFFPLALTLIGGTTGFFYVRDRWRQHVARAVDLALVALLLGSLATASIYVRLKVENRARETEIIEQAAARIDVMSAAGSCGVMTSYSPQITYFSECSSEFFRSHLEPGEALSRVDGENRYLLIIEDGKNQPEGEDLDDLIALTTGEAIVLHAEGETAEIYEFAP